LDFQQQHIKQTNTMSSITGIAKVLQNHYYHFMASR